MRNPFLIQLFLGIASTSVIAQAQDPIIDMHLHAMHADDQGPPPVSICAPFDRAKLGNGRPIRGPNQGAPIPDPFFHRPTCAKPLSSPKDDDTLRDRTLAILAQRNIVAVASGPIDVVTRWREKSPKRIIPAILIEPGKAPAISELRDMCRRGQVAVIGEVLAQYEGLRPDDPALEPYFALAEELDIPIAIHIGPGPQGAAYMSPETAKYRVALTQPLALEEVLLRHPRLRLYAAHAGWPKLDDMLAMLHAHPQLYVDVSMIDYVLPLAEFHRYLRTLVEAGFGERILFGSDQMVWPDAIDAAIDGIEAAPFLTKKQKRDILYNNAARFLRLPGASR